MSVQKATAFPLEKAVHDLEQDGVTIIPNVFRPEQIVRFRAEYDRLFTRTMDMVQRGPEDSYELITHFDKEVRANKTAFTDGEGGVIIETAPGRHDFTLGMDRGVFGSDEFQKPPIIWTLMKHLFGSRYVHNSGMLSSTVRSDDGPWHRDIYNLQGSAKADGTYDDFAVVHHFDPFYFTVLMPLVELTPDNGSTEFVQGSHRLTYAEAEDKPHLQFRIAPGSAIIFDGRIFHRGRRNKSSESMPVLYQVYTRDWYNDI